MHIPDVFGDEIKQRNIRLLFTAFVTMSIILVVLQFFTGSSTTGNSILLGSTAPEETSADDGAAVFNLNNRQKFDLLLKTLQLKMLDKEEQKLQYAEKIAKIDKLVHDSGNDDVLSGWTAMTACLDENGCTDEFYVFMKTLFAVDGQTENSFFTWKKSDTTLETLIQNVLELKLAAEKNNIVIRSKLVTDTNSLIISKGSLEMKEVWEQLVDCNFGCDGFDRLLLVIAESYFESQN